MDIGIDSNDFIYGMNDNIVDCVENVDQEDETGLFDSHGENNENHDKDPQVGMEFDSPENAYSLYKKYAKKMGFGVTTRSSRRSKLSGQFIDVKYVCTRHGTKRETNAVNPRPCLKMECKAMFHIKRKHDGKWFLHNFIKDHNHDLFPAHSHFFPCHRSINSAKRYDINTLHTVGVQTSKIFAAMAKQHGGYENIGCLEKDIRNHLDKERCLALESGDANAMLEFFMHMQEKDPNFFYAMDLDDEHRLKNVFWVDGKGVFNIPSRYILKRWTKDVRTKYKKGSGCEELQSKKQRRDALFDRATELIEEGSLSLESYNIAHQALQDALKRCSSVNHSLNLSNKDACGANESHDLGKENFDCNILHEKKILDPKDTQSKAGKSKDIGNNFPKDCSSNSGTQDVVATITNILCNNTSASDNTFDMWLKGL
ncbi:hypothetical protein CCACVL1_19590 [Corchorus capsularis]|uniref:Protein FAR1-RELATED SEQUENCE n=1 Tax=Corchorus capsularis TaxID=210143 RepID=A0A1R3HG09_COCAP|nr:hypothetical protein CCACVL1_19590 [Corchorus capsularis]